MPSLSRAAGLAERLESKHSAFLTSCLLGLPVIRMRQMLKLREKLDKDNDEHKLLE